jgi:hypothetical protein
METMTFALLIRRTNRIDLGWTHGQFIEFDNLTDDRRSWMTQSIMPLIQGNFLTNEGSKRLGKMITRTDLLGPLRSSGFGGP